MLFKRSRFSWVRFDLRTATKSLPVRQIECFNMQLGLTDGCAGRLCYNSLVIFWTTVLYMWAISVLICRPVPSLDFFRYLNTSLLRLPRRWRQVFRSAEGLGYCRRDRRQSGWLHEYKPSYSHSYRHNLYTTCSLYVPNLTPESGVLQANIHSELIEPSLLYSSLHPPDPQSPNLLLQWLNIAVTLSTRNCTYNVAVATRSVWACEFGQVLIDQPFSGTWGVGRIISQYRDCWM